MTDDELTVLARAMYAHQYGESPDPNNSKGDLAAYGAVYALTGDTERASAICDALIEQHVQNEMSVDELPATFPVPVTVDGERLYRNPVPQSHGTYLRVAGSGEWFMHIQGSLGRNGFWNRQNPGQPNQESFRRNTVKWIDRARE